MDKPYGLSVHVMIRPNRGGPCATSIIQEENQDHGQRQHEQNPLPPLSLFEGSHAALSEV